MLTKISNAQVTFDTTQVVNMINSCNYIFEGEILDKCSFQDPSNRMIYTVYNIQTTKLFKGDMECGTVSLFMPGGKTANENVTVSHVDEFHRGYQGIFGCTDTHFPSNLSCLTNTNNLFLSPVRYYASTITYHDDPFNALAEGFGVTLDDINILYLFLQVACGVNYTNCIEEVTLQKKVSKKKVRGPAPVVNLINGTTTNPYPTQGGNFDTITLTGNNFTTSGRLFLSNADAGGHVFRNLNSNDIISWTNTEIKFVVPNFVDSFDVFNAGKKSIIGSGYFGIENNLGDISDTTNTAGVLNQLDIRFTLEQTRVTADKINNLLFNETTFFPDSTYHFQLHTSVTNTNMINCIKTAIRRWKCLTGVNFVLDTGTTTDTIESLDGKNIIQIKTPPNAQAVASAQSSVNYYCTDTNGYKKYTKKDIDIYINPAFLFWYDTISVNTLDSIPANMTDFFVTIQHELGHAHSIGHVNDIWDPMYHTDTIWASPSPCSDRNLYLNSANQKAGDIIMDKSTHLYASCNDPFFTIIKMQDTNCRVTPLAIININQSTVQNISIYPNPATSILNVDFETSNNNPNSITIYDMLGKKVYQTQTKNLKNQINLNLNNGVYFIVIKNENNTFNSKVVWQN